MPVVADESYSAKTNDLSPVILKFKAANPDAVIHTAYIADAILFSRQAKERKEEESANVHIKLSHMLTKSEPPVLM